MFPLRHYTKKGDDDKGITPVHDSGVEDVDNGEVILVVMVLPQ